MSIVTTLLVLMSVTVGNNAELTTAIAAAKGGERIVLRPGNYGAVAVRNRTWDKPVTIESADPTQPAVISKFVAANTTGLTLRNIEFTRAMGSERVWAKIAEITGGANIRFEGGSIHGSLDKDPSNDMQGLSARGTRNLVVSGVKFQDLNAGLVCEDCSDFEVRKSVFSFIGTDGMDIPGARGATITDNFFHDFRPVKGAHPDGIQCWTFRKTSGCKDVTITGNTFRGDPGHEFQGVFFGDEANVGGYDRIKIAHNNFVCTMWHAVNIGLGSEIEISDNQVSAGPNYKPWFQTRGPAKLIGNIAPAYRVENKQNVPAGNRMGGAFRR
ncbi:right-handed parallel beta-helix repeat-containing protein [Sphingomonas sp.]|uniref:right-handed parallel beta-helix repeat-containing protein n=1 Tax=Sphingomonas sp. TaxID=28214 RepID=UPI0028ADE4E3|nr:right-handed parallel beta-helix repeat-containing protein [Sphingomonas sp.]